MGVPAPSVRKPTVRNPAARQPADEKLDVALLEQVSPIEWDNVILYGQYLLDRAQVP